MTELVLSERDGAVRTITLNRPARLNAMTLDLVAAVADAFHAANADDATRAIIFTGAGRAFCAGDDLQEHRQPAGGSAARAFVKQIQRATREIVLGEKMVVGAINGWAVGGGFEWAINCDLPIWGQSARGFFPEIYWGLFTTGAVTTILPNLVGLIKAREMILFGEKFDAQALHALGVAWRVVPDDRLMAEARAVAARIAELPAGAVTDLKTVLNRAAFEDVERAMERETEATVRGVLDPATATRVAEFSKR